MRQASKTGVSKRKVKAEADESEEETKSKKRKTVKGKSSEDMAPLAARTAISSLKKAMYIGAHVSGAGGMPFPHRR